MKDPQDEEEDLINKILNETLSLTTMKYGEVFNQGSISNNNVNSNELEFLILKNQLNYFSLDLIQNSKVFRVVLKDQIIDFPINWYFFKKIYEFDNRAKDVFSYLKINRDNDTEQVMTVLSSLLNCEPCDLLVIYSHNNAWICYGKNSCDEFLNEISKIENIKAA